MQHSLSALVAHDIKNALALLEIDLEQLNHRPDVPIEGARAYRRCVELKSRLIGFLTLYKYDQSGLNPLVYEVDLMDFLEELIMNSPSVVMQEAHQGAPLSVQVDRDRIRVDAACSHAGVGFFDENLLELALESVLNNAVRYAHHQISLWFEQDADVLVFKVLDDGESAASISGPPGEKEKSASTGLGLALCKAVAEVHGAGTIQLERLACGGTLFSMTLRQVTCHNHN